MADPHPRLSTINLSAPSPRDLAGFYAALLGYTIAVEEPDWVLLRGGGTGDSSANRTG